MMTNPNQPAFPEQEFYEEKLVGLNPGLTKREYFAAMALQGLLAHNADITYYEAAKDSVGYADKLITELNKPI